MGGLTWGYKVPNNKDDPVSLVNGTKKDYSLSASTAFKNLIEKANEVGAGDAMNPLPMRHAQPNGDPKISKPLKNLVGGTSALPGK
jgi:hypothetical protein